MLKSGSIMRAVLVAALMFCCLQASGQQDVTVLSGRVTNGGRAVPYATLQLKGTSVGVACNDDGEYRLKVPAGHEEDTVVVRSVGYRQAKHTVAELMEKGSIRLVENSVQLREVQVKSFRTARHLLNAAVERIDSNYRQRQAWSTFFYRDWRAVDGELYLFDEAVMSVRRAGYGRFAGKMAYAFDADRREMASNYKTVLKHRLVVFDRALLEAKVSDPEGVDDRLKYADNEEFYDPVAAPQASFSLARNMIKLHKFEPIQEYDDDGVAYYLLRSVGPCRLAKAKMHYEYRIRKDDLAIVSISAVQDSLSMMSPNESWMDVVFDRVAVAADSSVWHYDVRDGSYTLTHYYTGSTVSLGFGDAWHFSVRQRWQQSVDWTLTDYYTEDPGLSGDTIRVRPQTLAGAFGMSDYSGDFWGHYNSVPVDVQPLRLLREKLLKPKQ